MNVIHTIPANSVERACPHNRRASTCNKCSKSNVCIHGRQRSQCKECGGSSICPHRRIRSICRECRGGSICEHGKRRSRCNACLSVMNQICEHHLVRSQCKICVSKSGFRRFKKQIAARSVGYADGQQVQQSGITSSLADTLIMIVSLAVV